MEEEGEIQVQEEVGGGEAEGEGKVCKDGEKGRRNKARGGRERGRGEREWGDDEWRDDEWETSSSSQLLTNAQSPPPSSPLYFLPGLHQRSER